MTAAFMVLFLFVCVWFYTQPFMILLSDGESEGADINYTSQGALTNELSSITGTVRQSGHSVSPGRGLVTN